MAIKKNNNQGDQSQAIMTGAKKRKAAPDETDSSSAAALSNVSSMLLRKSNSKYKNHYAPVIPLSPEEETKWRKEARKKRNRDSAAASRQKARQRIQDLEDEVNLWKSKYDALFQKMSAIENMIQSTMSYVGPQQKQFCMEPLPIKAECMTVVNPQDAPPFLVSPSHSPKLQPRPAHVIPESPSQKWESPGQLSSSCHPYYNKEAAIHQQHINEVPSRPA